MFSQLGYALVATTGLLGVLFGWLLVPWHTHASILVVTYFQHQMFFVLSHLTFHAMFVELDPKDYSAGAKFAFDHHQPGNQRVLSDYWCAYRCTWFFTKSALRLHALTFWVARCTLPNTQTLIVYFAAWLFFMNLQAICQEYFHVDFKDRNHCFMSGTLWGLSLLESCGILDFHGHKAHHHHDDQIRSNPNMETFTDMWCPFLNRLAVYFWNQKLLPLHETGQLNMTYVCHAWWVTFGAVMFVSMICLAELNFSISN